MGTGTDVAIDSAGVTFVKGDLRANALRLRRISPVKTTYPALRWLLTRASRYTRNVSWRHRISVVLLLLLTALPVSGTVCTVLCDSAAATSAAAHHASGTPCDDEQATTPSSGPEMGGTAGHDCSDHDAAIREAATITATRADSLSGPVLLVAVAVHDSITKLTDSDAVFDYRTPPGSTPPTASPLVLRV
jgi:hypothetical protein